MKRIYKSLMQGPIYVIVFGMVFFGVGAGLSYKQYRVERDGEHAQGEVIRLSTNCDEDGCTYSPVVRFTMQNGRTITFESMYSSSPPSYDVGEKVTVIYPTETPEKAEIKGGGRWFRIIFATVGGVIIAFGLYMFYGNVRDNYSTDDDIFESS